MIRKKDLVLGVLLGVAIVIVLYLLFVRSGDTTGVSDTDGPIVERAEEEIDIDTEALTEERALAAGVWQTEDSALRIEFEDASYALFTGEEFLHAGLWQTRDVAEDRLLGDRVMLQLELIPADTSIAPLVYVVEVTGDTEITLTDATNEVVTLEKVQ